MAHAPVERHYGMDWLRIAAFSLLIAYHIGMMFVPWGWHIKTQQPVEWLVYPMLAVNPWRLSLLFLVSGFASRAMLSKASVSLGGFLRQRTVRLLLPLAVGIAVIIPPQSWAELRMRGAIESDFLTFWTGDYFGLSPIDGVMVPTYNHLWFILYLFAYTIVLAAILALMPRGLRDQLQSLFDRLLGHPLTWIAAPIAVLVAIYAALYPADGLGPQIFVGDWYRHALYFFMFAIGFALARAPRVWEAIRKCWPFALALGLAGYLSAMLDIGGGVDFVVPIVVWATIIQAWGIIAGLIGLADRFWNKDAKWRNYLALGVFPFYIIHQTIIVVAGYFLIINAFTVTQQFLIVTFATLAGCWLFYEIVLRMGPAKAMFGLQHKPAQEAQR